MSSRDPLSRVVIEQVKPEINGGRFAIKRTLGETVEVEADIFTDGHDHPAAVLRYRREEASDWQEVPMGLETNDRWRGRFVVDAIGRYRYTLEAWIDHFGTWLSDFRKRVDAGQEVAVDLLIGAALVEEAVGRARGADQKKLSQWALRLKSDEATRHADQVCHDAELAELMAQYAPRDPATAYGRELEVLVDRERARFSTWYEMFPRSCSGEPGRHGTLKDCEARIPYVASMGFDVLYLPPIHPIGHTCRKGTNNAPESQPEDVGSPWGIGAAEGGHKAVHPELGTLVDFRRLVVTAEKHGIEIALDIAFQCSPDHPYMAEHPDWFRQRPDGTIQYAENPPKKYQDIYPFDFETDDWQALWEELKSIFLFWIEQGVRIFRVDNPHTKPFAFWEWCISEIKQSHPDVLFLAEAFTRPKVMYRLAKLGFTQSYTYFAWRNRKHELTRYLEELTQTEVREFCRPNLWPNTPDILTEYLQVGGQPAFIARLVLAATLGASYGIYGPPFEHGWTAPREPGSEEYRDSEKYQVHDHDLERPDSLRHLVARVNRLRREHRVLQSNDGLRFHEVDNEHIICYSKTSTDREEILVVAVNLDPHHRQSGWIELPLEELGLDADRSHQMHDLLGEARYLWQGPRNYVDLDPKAIPAHVFRVRRHARTERDFEYFL